MNDIQIFKNEEFGEIRSLTIDSEPYFVGKDVADILGYGRPDNAIRLHVEAEDKLTHQISASGQARNMTIINESGLYSLILASKLPTAKKFKKWVTRDVLPAIRKTGGYIAGEEKLTEDELVLKAMTVLNKKVENLKAKNNLLQLENTQNRQMIGELKPKADYTDKILQSKNTVTVTAIAKDYGMSAIELNRILHDLKIQYKQSGQWFLYEKYQRCGYTHSKTTEYIRNDGSVGSNLNTEWTQKGRLFLYNKLKERGIIPLIERE